MMKHTWKFRAVSIVLCLVLAAATALLATGCSVPETPDTTASSVTTVADATTDSTQPAQEDAVTVIGEGDTAFALTVTDLDGVSTAFDVHTDKETVGEALLELGLIAGDESEYGLYVKTVNGLTVDYDTDGAYWAFYINGEYAMSGVDTTAIEVGASYELRAEKA